MTASAPTVILDAGPCVTFCAADKHLLLLNTLKQIGPLCAPATVDGEIRAVAQRRKFPKAVPNWDVLIRGRFVEILSDDPSDDLDWAMKRITGLNLAQRVQNPADLGETMVMAHALLFGRRGYNVVLMIDEHRGRAKAAELRPRFQRAGLRLQLAATDTVLVGAARRNLITDRGEMRRIYAQLRQYDLGLMAIEQTTLLDKTTWERSA